MKFRHNKVLAVNSVTRSPGTTRTNLTNELDDRVLNGHTTNQSPRLLLPLKEPARVLNHDLVDGIVRYAHVF